MKRSINVIDLENRIQNNLNPSIKCKKETNEPKEEIKSTDRLTPKNNIHLMMMNLIQMIILLQMKIIVLF